MSKSVVYFSGMNALRFFAASLVVFHHAEQIRIKNDLFNLKLFSFFNNGGIAVTFFFVLSGFLITYLLLKEKVFSGSVSIKKFYFRRILRIWPLYFLLVFLGTLLIPFLISFFHITYEMPYTFSDVIMYYVFFAPFMVTPLFGHHLLEPLWSIGVEEIFYIFWAPLVKFVKVSITKVAFSVILIKGILVWASHYVFQDFIFITIFRQLQFESMAVGAIGAAWIFHNYEKAFTSFFLFNRFSQMVLFSFVFIRLFFVDYLVEHSPLFSVIHDTFAFHLFINFLFLWLILNISMNVNSIIRLESRVLNLMGEISYGIYMYHMIVIFSVILFFRDLLEGIDKISATFIFYFFVFSGTILVSYLSKRFFEDYFLNLKSKYRV